MSIIVSFTIAYLINTSSHIPKEAFLADIRQVPLIRGSPPDKGDLGGFFHEKALLDNTLKLFMRRTVYIYTW